MYDIISVSKRELTVESAMFISQFRIFTWDLQTVFDSICVEQQGLSELKKKETLQFLQGKSKNTKIGKLG